MKITVNKSKINTSTIKEVVIKEATVQNMIDANRLSGTSEGVQFVAAMISQICTFDGKMMTYEDVATLPIATFLELTVALETSGVLPSESAFSSLSGTGISATKR